MRLYSNEIVFRGHPDKVCDQISDALLDEHLKQDSESRCAIEVVGGKGILIVTGEVKTDAVVDVKGIVNRVLEEVGYKEMEIIENIGKQSKEIAKRTSEEIGGAGDNGMMFGYATDETEERLPKALLFLKELAKRYEEIRKHDKRFGSDGKAQLTGIYDDRMRLKGIKSITVCYQNTEKEREKTDRILKDVLMGMAKKYEVEIENILFNPSGEFSLGGFEADTGLTGRKIVVDSYQSFAPVGGGAFSGKDATKVDRSGAYKARELAKRILEEYGLRECVVQLSYSIGKEEPDAIYVDSEKGSIEVKPEWYEECKPRRIIEDLGLKKPQFEKLAMYGHMGEQTRWG